MELCNFLLGVGTGTKNYNEEILRVAIDNSYTFLDCANMYPTQRNVVGPTIQKLKTEGTFQREKMFITSKLNFKEMGMVRKYDWEQFGNDIFGNTSKALKELNISYLDLMLIHWPLRENPKTGHTEEFIIEEIWPYMEELVNRKMVRYIGVSNFGLLELQRLLFHCKIRPYVNEVEYNPYQTNKEVIDFCKQEKINVIGTSPYAFGWNNNHILKLLSEPILEKIAKKYDTTPAIIILQWNIDTGVFPIPGTSKKEHLLEWKRVGTFSLDEDEINEINSLNKNVTLYDNKVYAKHKLCYYPKFSFKKYECLVGNENNNDMRLINTGTCDFLKQIKDSITIGPGYIVLKQVLNNYIHKIKEVMDSYDKDVKQRWDGTDPRNKDKALINQDPVFIEIINNPVLGMIVDTLLGWDCIIDNCSFSTSRPAPNNGLFGPHIDSPFEQHPGAIIPPHTYPMVLQCIHCIDDFTKDNGSLFVIPHSHKRRERVHFTSQKEVKTGIIPKDAVTVEAQKGDIIVAVGNIFHGALQNKTSEKRRGILIEFISSVVEPRDRYNDGNIKEEIYKLFPRRMIRLFYGGKHNFKSGEGLFTKWSKFQ